MKTAQDIANKVTQEARAKMKTVFDKKAWAPMISMGDNELVKILQNERKHKIEDRYKMTSTQWLVNQMHRSLSLMLGQRKEKRNDFIVTICLVLDVSTIKQKEKMVKISIKTARILRRKTGLMKRRKKTC